MRKALMTNISEVTDTEHTIHASLSPRIIEDYETDDAPTLRRHLMIALSDVSNWINQNDTISNGAHASERLQ